MTTPTLIDTVAAAWDFETSGRSVVTASANIGDTIYAYSLSNFSPITAPSGTWTVGATGGGSEGGQLRRYSRNVTVAGPQTVTLPGTSPSESALIVYLLRGVDSTDGEAGVEGTGTSQVASSVSPTGTDDLLLCVWVCGNFSATALNYTAIPAGMTQDEEPTDGSFIIGLGCHQTLAASGATGTRTATSTSQDAGWAAITTAVKGTAGGGPTAVGKDLALLYDVRAALGDTCSLLWDARAAVSDSLQAIWDVRALVNDQVAVLWDTRAAVGRDAALLWDVRSALGDVLVLSWDVRANLGDSIALVWDTRAPIGQNLVVLWDIESLAISVGKDLTLSWNVQAIVGDSLAIVYDVRSAIGDTLAVLWDTRAAVNDSVALLWDARVVVGDSQSLLWDVRAIAGDDLGLAWSINQAVGEELTLVWSTESLTPTLQHLFKTSVLDRRKLGVAGVPDRWKTLVVDRWRTEVIDE